MDSSRYVPPNQVDPTSTRLLRRVADRDEVAWQQIVSLYGPVVRYWIRGAGLTGSDLADVFQEVFIAVSRNIASFDREEGAAKFRAWLKTVTLSKVNDHFRRAGKRPVAFGGSTALLRIEEIEANDASTDESDDGDAALSHSEDAFLAQRTLRIVRKEFRENTWNAFYRTAIDGQTSRQVAEELNMSALAVRKAKSRVIQRLKEMLDGPDQVQ